MNPIKGGEVLLSVDLLAQALGASEGVRIRGVEWCYLSNSVRVFVEANDIFDLAGSQFEPVEILEGARPSLLVAQHQGERRDGRVLIRDEALWASTSTLEGGYEEAAQ